MMSKKSNKLFIPHPADPNCNIVGILEQLEPDQATSGRKIALILHGAMGHKDYLFQKKLALRLPMDSFRFDFRGNHETGGKWKQGNFEDDIEDLNAVVAHLKETYGYVVDLVVGHSRGAIVGFNWVCTSEDGRKVSGFVNASGRYRMNKILETKGHQAWKDAFDKQGHYVWTVTVARTVRTVEIYPEDVESFVRWDTSIIERQFPNTIDVITIHGLNDKTVATYDAAIYAHILGSRTPGTHTLHLMEDADHNFTGRQDEVVDLILSWWDVKQRGEIKSPFWVPELRSKL